MRCPECKQKAISFFDWGFGKRWLRYQCPHCGSTLKASGRTWLTLGVTFITVLLLSVVAIDPILTLLGIKDERIQQPLVFTFIILLILPAAYWDWKTGTYACVKITKSSASQSMKNRAKFLMGLSAVLFVFLTALGAYDSILLFVGDFTDAEVISYTQKDPGVVREGDWAMTYRFADASGKSYTKGTTFAPKKRPEVSEGIRVRYLTFAPSVSGPAGYTSGTGLTGYMMVIWILFLGARDLYRAKKSAQVVEISGS